MTEAVRGQPLAVRCLNAKIECPGSSIVCGTVFSSVESTVWDGGF